MDERVALHTAARWYSISAVPNLMPGSQAEWYNHPIYESQEEHPFRHREWTRADFWHEEFLPALLWEVERLVPADFASVDQLHQALVDAGRHATAAVWEHWSQPHYHVVWTDERADDAENRRLLAVEQGRFEAHIAALRSGHLGSVDPLPFRRTLSDEEVGAIWDGLHARWPDPRLWFLGLAELEQYEHHEVEGVYSFWWSRFAENVPLDAVRAALREAGVPVVWQVGGYHPYDVDYEVYVETFVPDGEEAHFTSVGLDWVMYCDHESRITVGGDLVTRLVAKVWPDWERYEDEGYAVPDF